MTTLYLILLGLTIATVASQYFPGDGCCIRWNVAGTCCINEFGQCCGDVTPFVEENIVPGVPVLVDDVRVGHGGHYSGGRWKGGRVVGHVAPHRVVAHRWNGNKGHRGAANHHGVVSHSRDRHG